MLAGVRMRSSFDHRESPRPPVTLRVDLVWKVDLLRFFRTVLHPLRWTGAHLLASRQRFSGVDNDRRLTRVVVVLCDRVHGVVGVGSFPVDTFYSAVAYGAAIVPGNFRTRWNRLERSFLRFGHYASPAWSVDPHSHGFPGAVHH